jgi:hypothetical protein
MKDEIEIVFRFVDDCRFDPKSRAWRKAELLNVLVETHRALIKEHLELSPAVVSKELSIFFERVDKAGAGQEEADEVTSYYKASIQATNDRSNRIKRGKIPVSIVS